MLSVVLRKLGMDDPSWKLSPFISKEDGEAYDVWRIENGREVRVLKRAKAYELAVYQHFFNTTTIGAPSFLGSARHEGTDYFLMSYAEGDDLCRCTRTALTKALDALVALQDAYWENRNLADAAYTFEKSLENRIDRGKYLGSPRLEAAYEGFLDAYKRIPRTLCHDDLLPFNVLVSEDGAVLIDWEYGGILPYLSPLARLIAHTAEEEGAFFYMTEADRQFAIDYYYEHLVKGKGISYETYRKDLDDFLLYEYCEWIMLGNQYGDRDSERFKLYWKKAMGYIGEVGK